MFCFGFWCISNYCYVFVLISLFGIMVCLVSLLFPLEQLYGVRFVLQGRAIIFLCNTSLIRVIN